MSYQFPRLINGEIPSSPPCQALIRLQSNQQSSHYKSGIKEEMLSLNQPSQPTILLPYRLLHLSTETIKDIKRILFTSYHRLIALLLSIFSVCSEIVVKIHWNLQINQGKSINFPMENWKNVKNKRNWSTNSFLLFKQMKRVANTWQILAIFHLKLKNIRLLAT